MAGVVLRALARSRRRSMDEKIAMLAENLVPMVSKLRHAVILQISARPFTRPRPPR
jgi:hypothetical protein